MTGIIIVVQKKENFDRLTDPLFCMMTILSDPV